MIIGKNIESLYSTRLVLWIIFYCYATFAALIFQKLLLPMFPGFCGGSGLIGGGDSAFFHEVAARLAESIRTYGWGAWSIWPAEGAMGNVSLLGVLYVIFGNDPTVVIPLNAALHATSGLFVFLVARALWPGKVGVYSGVIASSLFVVFPSALNWYAQIHKDGFAILGMLIIFYSWIKGIAHSSRLWSGIWILVGGALGFCLVAFVRPCNSRLLMLAGCLALVFLCGHLLLKGKVRERAHLPVYFLIFTSMMVLMHEQIPARSTLLNETDILVRSERPEWHWTKTKILPEKIDRILANAAEVRVHNIVYGQRVGARSLIDQEVEPDRAGLVLRYMPRAAAIGLFAPFPKMWLESSSIIRLVSVGETAIWYLLVPGVFLAFWYRRSLPLFLIFGSAILFLSIYGFTLPNLGTLYRIRYLHMFLLMTIGIMGWVELVKRRCGDRIRKARFSIETEDLGEASSDCAAGQEDRKAAGVLGKRSTVATAGMAVAVFTLLSSMLFVMRDVVLARWFGLSSELDAFFVAMIVPMFLVTVLSMPIGTTMVPLLLSAIKEGSKEKTQQLITQCSTRIFCWMLLVCLALLLSSHYFIPLLGWGFSADKIVQAQVILFIIAPLFFFSGFVILGNSILNAREKFALPALAQCVVPLIAMLCLLLLARQIGIYAMAIGMVVGQLGNLFIVSRYVRKEGYSLLPVVRLKGLKKAMEESLTLKRALSSEYLPLVFSSLFISLALPVNNAIAASLGSGSVSAFNLGTKFVVFFTGLMGTGISTVMLPYFSFYFARNNVIEARRELSFFLFLATVISIPLTIMVYLVVGFIVNMVFGGDVFSAEDTSTVTRVLAYGIIQLPFFCTNMLFAKYVNARRKSALVMISSLLGLLVNIVLNFVFIGHMGVAGIALASSLSMMLSTMVFIIVGHRYNDVSWVDFLFITLTWLLFLTILLCYHFKSMSGVVISSGSLVLTVICHLAVYFGYRFLAVEREG